MLQLLALLCQLALLLLGPSQLPLQLLLLALLLAQLCLQLIQHRLVPLHLRAAHTRRLQAATS